MNIETSPKSIYLLNAAVDVLHVQSNEWISEIAFWRDEAAFFYALVVEKTQNSVPLGARELLEDLEKKLVSLTGGELEALDSAVKKHENLLAHLIETQSGHEEEYRDKHTVLAMKFSELERNFKTIKKEIFELMKLSGKQNG